MDPAENVLAETTGILMAECRGLTRTEDSVEFRLKTAYVALGRLKTSHLPQPNIQPPPQVFVARF